jgi:acetyl esterase/lipase
MRFVIFSGLTFAEIPGYRPLLLDLHVPDGARQPAPVVIWIHGGGYSSGDRRYLPPTLEPGSVFAALTGAGMACATVDYRLRREAGWPAQRDDVAAAIGYLRARAGEYGLDMARLGTLGESAGGQLALMTGLTSPGVRAVVAWYPLTDFGLLAGPAPVMARRSLGRSLQDFPDVLTDASPVTHVTSAAPPALLVHGDQDQALPAVHSERYHEALVAAGVESVCRIVPGADHCFEGYADVAGLIAESVSFLASRLLP